MSPVKDLGSFSDTPGRAPECVMEREERERLRLAVAKLTSQVEANEARTDELETSFRTMLGELSKKVDDERSFLEAQIGHSPDPTAHSVDARAGTGMKGMLCELGKNMKEIQAVMGRPALAKEHRRQALSTMIMLATFVTVVGGGVWGCGKAALVISEWASKHVVLSQGNGQPR